MTDELLLAFSGTHQVIAAEQALLQAGLAVKVMPAPVSISAGCGLCLRLSPALLEQAWEVLVMQKVPCRVFRHSGGRYAPAELFSQVLGLATGDVVCLIGCGGKTSLLHRLAGENREKPVLLSTTTHILRPGPGQADREAADGGGALPPGINLYYTREEDGKLSVDDPGRLKPFIPSNGLTLLECDGSRGRPLKGWLSHEPAVPGYATATVGVCSLQPLGQALSTELVHRPQRFADLTGAAPGDVVEPAHIAAMLGHPLGMFSKGVGRLILYLNGVDGHVGQDRAQEVAELLPGDLRRRLAVIALGSLELGWCRRIGGNEHDESSG